MPDVPDTSAPREPASSGISNAMVDSSVNPDAVKPAEVALQPLAQEPAATPAPAPAPAPQAPAPAPDVDSGVASLTPDQMKNFPSGNPTPAAAPAGFDWSKTAAYDPSQVAKVAVGWQQGESPVTAAKILDVSARSGMDPELVKQDPDGIEKAMNQANFSPSYFSQTNPKLAAFIAANPMHAPLIKDDLPNIKQTQDSMNEYGMMKDAYDALGVGMAQTLSGISRIPGVIYDMAAIPQNILAAATGWDSLRTRAADLPLQNKIGEYYDNQAKLFTDSNSDLNMKIGDEVAKGNYSRAGRAAFISMVQGAPQLAQLMIGGMQAHAAKLMMLGLEQAGNASARPENLAAGPVASTIDALGQGAIAAGAGEFGNFKVLENWGNTLVQNYGKPAASAVIKSFASAMGYAFTRDASSQAALSAANDLTDYATGVNPDALQGIGQRSIESGFVGGLTGVVLQSPASVISFHGSVHDLRQAQLQKDFYMSLGDSAQASKVRERLPQKYQEMVQALTKDGPVQNIHVEPEALETYYQTKGPDEVAKMISQLGVEKEFDQAKETGGLVKIPTEKWATEIAPDKEAHAALADHITFDPEQPTISEANTANERAVETEKQVHSEGGIYQDLDKTPEAQIQEKLQKIGQTKDTAKKAASLYRFFSVNAPEGETPQQFFDRYNIDITKELPEGLRSKNIDEFDPLLNRVRNGDIPTEKKAYGQSLIEYLKGKGGVNTAGPGSDVEAMEIKGLSKRKGMDLDRAAEIAHESGYLSDRSIPELLSKLDQESRGKKVYSEQNRTVHADDRETLTQIQEHLKSVGADLSTMDNETAKKALAENQDTQKPRDLTDYMLQGADKPLGGIKFGPDGVNIALLEKANLSTFLHETGHLFFKVMGDLAEHPNASDRSKEIYQSLRDFAGLEDGQKIETEHHEKIAEGFEKYLMEGKAPTSALRQAFASFKAWLIHAYQSLVAHPGVKLTDEVRSAFDRMIATDEEIHQAQRESSFQPLFRGAFEFMNETQATKYANDVREATQAAQEKLTSDSLKALKKEQSQQYKAERNQVENEVRNEVNELPQYQLIDKLQNGVINDQGEKQDLKLNKKQMIADFGKEVVSEMPRGIWDKDGLDYNIVADTFGLQSGHELAMMLANTQDKEELIQHQTDDEMRQRYSHTDPALSGDTMEQAAQDAIHNDKSSEMMASELRYLLDNKLASFKGMMKSVNRRLLTAAAFKEQASSIIAGTATRDIKPFTYQRAEAKYGNEALAHALKGNWNDAFVARSKELLNHELYKASRDAQKVIEDGVDGFKDFHQSDKKLSPNRDMDLVNAGRVILDKFGIGSVERGADATSYLEKLKRYDDGDQYGAMKAMVDSALANAQPYGDMPFEKFVALKDTMDAMWGLSRENKQMTVDGVKISNDEAKEAVKGRISEIKSGAEYDKGIGEPSKAQARKTKFLSMASALIRVESWCQGLDNGDINGPMTKYIWRPIKEASVRYNLASHDYEKKVNALVKEHLNDMGKKPIEAPELGQGAYFRKESDLVGALLHTGNESNLRKLLVGRGWGIIDEHGNLDRSKWDSFIKRAEADGTITKNHRDFTQNVWDLLEELKPDAQKAYKARYGTYFDEITANKVDTKFGDYKGGYFPAAVDRNLNNDRVNAQITKSLDTDSEATLWPQKMDGFTKNRNDNYNAPLSLNLNMINNHIDQALKFVHLQPAVHDVSRVVLDREVSSSLNGLHKDSVQDILAPWLKRSMNQSVATTTEGVFKKLDPIFNYIRSNTGAAAMFANVKNVLLQTHGVVLAATQVDPKFLARAGIEVLSHPKELANTIAEKSDYMKMKFQDHGFEMTKTLNDIVQDKNPLQTQFQFFQRNAYFAQTMAQNMVNLIAWHGAYDEHISKGGSEDDAVNKADAVISQTQHNFAPESMSAIEHGNAFFRLFTQFYSYQNLRLNLQASEFYKSMKFQGLAPGAMRAAYVYGMSAMIPAALMSGMNKALSGQSWDENGNDGPWLPFLADAGMNLLEETIAEVPLAGTTVNTMIDNLKPGHRIGDDRAYSPVAETLASLGRAPAEGVKALEDGRLNHKQIRDGLTVLSLITGAPIGALSRPLNYLNDVNSGKANPSGPLDFTRGLISGQSGK